MLCRDSRRRLALSRRELSAQSLCDFLRHQSPYESLHERRRRLRKRQIFLAQLIEAEWVGLSTRWSRSLQNGCCFMNANDTFRTSYPHAAAVCILLKTQSSQKLSEFIWNFSTDFSTAQVEVFAKMFRLIKRKETRLFFGNAHLIPIGHHLVSATEHRSRTRSVGSADQPFAFHNVQNRGGTPVADAQTTLQHRR